MAKVEVEDYEVLESFNSYGLTAEVRGKIGLGYEPYGPLVVSGEHADRVFAQAMVKYREIIEPVPEPTSYTDHEDIQF